MGITGDCLPGWSREEEGKGRRGKEREERRGEAYCGVKVKDDSKREGKGMGREGME